MVDNVHWTSSLRAPGQIMFIWAEQKTNRIGIDPNGLPHVRLSSQTEQNACLTVLNKIYLIAFDCQSLLLLAVDSMNLLD
jgi:hypothetical protein